MSEFKHGDRVYVDDLMLARLRQIMQQATGEVPPPNHHGTVEVVLEDSVLIYFDSEYGPGMGSAAPYPANEVHHLPEATDA